MLMLWSSRNRWHKVLLRVGVQGYLEMKACVERLHKKQVDPRFPSQLHSAGDFPSTNQQKSKGLLSERD